MYLSTQEPSNGNPFSIMGARRSYLPTTVPASASPIEDLELLMSESAASARASVLLSIMSVQGEEREQALRGAQKVSSPVLDAVIASMTDASPFCHSLATHVLKTMSGSIRVTIGELLMYAAALGPVIEAFDSKYDVTAADAMYDIRAVSVMCIKRLQSGETPSTLSIETRMDIARGCLIWINTNPGTSPFENGTDESMLWLGSQWSRLSTIVPELVQRQSCDPMLIADLLLENSSKLLREGIL